MSNTRCRMLNGYRVVYKPENKKSMKNDNWEGFIYEHIEIAEKFLKREIRENEVVHHLDGNRSNNRIENLLVLERSQHSKLHKWLEKKGDITNESCNENGMNSTNSETEEQQKYCLSCGRTLQKKQRKYCCEKCFPRDKVSKKPNKKELETMLKNKRSYTSIGKDYGVSGNSVKKWTKKFGLYTKTLSQASGTPEEGAETTGEVKSS